jgi:hypothetical protein
MHYWQAAVVQPTPITGQATRAMYQLVATEVGLEFLERRSIPAERGVSLAGPQDLDGACRYRY